MLVLMYTLSKKKRTRGVERCNFKYLSEIVFDCNIFTNKMLLYAHGKDSACQNVTF